MDSFRSLHRLAAVAVALSLSGAAWAAAPAALDDPATAPADTMMAPLGGQQMNVEMTVRNWVLCATKAYAERLVLARAQGVDEAKRAYDALRKSRSCGMFPELHVILKSSLYRSKPEADYRAQIYGALVNIAGGWASGYVVEGSLPAQ